MSTGLASIGVLICTRNERLNVRQCLASVAWADERFVVDAFSEDGTAAICHEMGAWVVRRRWTGYAEQKNWALSNLPVRTEWILLLDADEWVSAALQEEIRGVTQTREATNAAYAIPRRLRFLGRELRRAWWYPDYSLRLVRAGLGKFEDRGVHESMVVDGAVGYLRQAIMHDDRRPVADYVARLNRYSSLEAYEMSRVRAGVGLESRVQPRWRGTWAERRRALKERVWYRLPGRPWLRFTWSAVVRLGVLDGREGLIFIGLAAINEWLADVKRYELKVATRRGRELPSQIPESHGPSA